jgi:hypothetical protein
VEEGFKMYERIKKIYEKYKNVDINLAIYLEKHGLDLDTYNCHDFIMFLNYLLNS